MEGIADSTAASELNPNLSGIAELRSEFRANRSNIANPCELPSLRPQSGARLPHSH